MLMFVVSSPCSLRRHEARLTRSSFRQFCLVLLAILMMSPGLVRASDQPLNSENGDSVVRSVPPPEPVASNLVFEGLASYGNYKIFASGTNCKLYTSGIEYDRNSWGRFLHARMDYVGEILPLVLLVRPVEMDFWGNTKSYQRETVPGFGISPIGFRLLWRDGRAFKPYMSAKGGILVFSKKAPSSQSTYENFSLQSAMGVNVRMNPKIDLRLGLFSDVHFSNAFMVPSNPGLDVMNANIGISYNLGRRPAVR